MLTVKIIPNETGCPVGKLANVEIHFTTEDITERPSTSRHADTVLAGMKLIGFSIWERRIGTGRNVTFPARQYSINGERRSFALLRPIEDTRAQDRIRELILEAYQQYIDSGDVTLPGEKTPTASTADEQAAQTSTVTTSGPDDLPF